MASSSSPEIFCEYSREMTPSTIHNVVRSEEELDSYINITGTTITEKIMIPRGKNGVLFLLSDCPTQEEIQRLIIRGNTVLSEMSDRVTKALLYLESEVEEDCYYAENPVFIKESKIAYVKAIQYGVLGLFKAFGLFDLAEQAYYTAYAMGRKGDGISIQMLNVGARHMTNTFSESEREYDSLMSSTTITLSYSRSITPIYARDSEGYVVVEFINSTFRFERDSLSSR